jgi:predicted P-loop ATPase
VTTDAFAALLDEPRWMAWREEIRGSARARPTKVPYAAGTGNYGSATDPATWGTHAQAEARARQLDDGSKAVGCGTVLGDLGDDTYLGGVDLDSSLDENGSLAPWAVRIISVLQTYAEISPSGRGLKAFFLIPAELVRWFLDLIGVEKDAWGCKRGIPGLDGANHGPAVEIYTSARYFTVTGQIWSDDHPHIVTLDRDQLVALAALIPSLPGHTASVGGTGNGTETGTPKAGAPAPRNSRDNSRSARAARIAIALMPDTYDDMVDGLRNHAGDDIRTWIADKGAARNERELKRIWDRIVARRTEARQAGIADLEARTGNGLDPDPGAGGNGPPPPPPPGDDPKPDPGADEDPGARMGIPPLLPPGEVGRRQRQCPPAVGREAVFTRKPNWRTGLLKNAKGQIRACLANAIFALRHAPEWDDRLWFDMFHNRVVLRGAPPWSDKIFDDEPWSDLFDNLATNWLQHNGIFVSHEITGRAVWTVARDQWFHPVRQYLERCRRSWDEQRRVFNWPTTYLGTPHDAYSAAVGQRWLISLVARIMDPGCKADSALVLEGPQGIFKSEVLRRLGWPWVTDDMGGAPLGSKDAALQVAGVWIMELAELDQFTTGRDVAKTKSFMSRMTDRFRPPYGTHPIPQPRQCCFGCTTNKHEYLPDETGNRRWWPLICTGVDLEQLDIDRDQLFGEAVALYEAGAPWWLDTLELTELAAAEQDQRYVPDAWDPLIRDYLDNPTEEHWDSTINQKIVLKLPPFDSITVGEILELVLKLKPGEWRQPEQNRVARSLRALKWARRQKGPRGDREWRYFRPEEGEKEE